MNWRRIRKSIKKKVVMKTENVLIPRVISSRREDGDNRSLSWLLCFV